MRLDNDELSAMKTALQSALRDVSTASSNSDGSPLEAIEELKLEIVSLLKQHGDHPQLYGMLAAISEQLRKYREAALYLRLKCHLTGTTTKQDRKLLGRFAQSAGELSHLPLPHGFEFQLKQYLTEQQAMNSLSELGLELTTNWLEDNLWSPAIQDGCLEYFRRHFLDSDARVHEFLNRQ